MNIDLILDDAKALPTATNDLKSVRCHDISVSDKVTEINCHTHCKDASLSPCAVMLGLLYMHRLVHKKPNYLSSRKDV